MPEFHGMLPGSHEWPSTPECRCGADWWDRWNDRCTTRELKIEEDPSSDFEYAPMMED